MTTTMMMVVPVTWEVSSGSAANGPSQRMFSAAWLVLTLIGVEIYVPYRVVGTITCGIIHTSRTCTRSWLIQGNTIRLSKQNTTLRLLRISVSITQHILLPSPSPPPHTHSLSLCVSASPSDCLSVCFSLPVCICLFPSLYFFRLCSLVSSLKKMSNLMCSWTVKHLNFWNV